MATAAVQPKPMVSPEEYLASQPKVSPEEYLQSATEPVVPIAAPPVHTDSGFGPPQVFQGVKAASPVAAAQGAFADYNSRWKIKSLGTPPPDDGLAALPQHPPATPPPVVPGMEQLGGAPPAPPPIRMQPRQTLNPGLTPGAPGSPEGVKLHPEVKQENYPGLAGKTPVGGEDLALTTATGVATAGRGVGKVASALGPPRLPNQSPATGDAQPSKLDLPKLAEGVHDVAAGAFDTLGQLIPTSIAEAGAARVLKPLVTGALAQKGADAVAEKAGVRPEYRSVIGDVAAIAGGAIGERLGSATRAAAPQIAKIDPPIVDKSGERMPVFGEEHLEKAEPAVTPEQFLAEKKAVPVEGEGASAPKVSPEEFLASEEKPAQVSGPTFGVGLGALQPHYDAAVAVLKGDVEATRALIAKRDMALAALKKAESTPSEKDAGHKILEYFTGERDVWGARMNQVIDRLRKVVPDHTEQEGLSLMRDFKSRPGELQEFLAGTHPTMRAITDPAKWLTAQERIEQMRPSIEKALNPTPGMMAADSVLTNIAELSLLEGRKRGFLESNVSSDEYVTHLLHPPEMADFRPLTEKAGSLMGGKIGRRFAFSESRQYPTLLDAVADNQKPRTLNALTAFTIHADKFATSRATSLLVDQLRGTGVGKWAMGTDKVPDGWVEIAPHAHPFQNTVTTLSQAGDPTSMAQKLYVPKFIEEALRPITDPDFSNKIVGFMPLRVYQAWTKSIQLGLSAFHATAMNFMATANMGLKGLAKGWAADRDSPAFLDGERRFIAHGGTTSIQGKTFEAYHSLEPGSIPGKGDILRVMPGIATADRAANKITEFTFGKLQRQFKVTDFALKEAAWTAKNPTASAAQRVVALQSIAKEINAVYGGLHWENLGVNRTTLNVARALMLAPDWTLSNYFNVKTAMEGGLKAAGHQAMSAVGVKAPSSWAGSAGSDAARAFWARQAAYGLTATQMMSLMLSGKPSQRPFEVYMGTDKDGNEIYQNMFFKGASGDLITWYKNSAKLGLLGGAAKTALGKAAPLIRTGLQTGMNEDYRGQAIIPKGTDFLPATVRGLGIAASDMAPIPLSGVNLFRMATGPKADSTTLPEYATTPFVGQPPSHVPPDGMRMTPQGLKPKREGQAKSFWDQTFNRKGPPPVHLGR